MASISNQGTKSLLPQDSQQVVQEKEQLKELLAVEGVVRDEKSDIYLTDIEIDEIFKGEPETILAASVVWQRPLSHMLY